MKLAAALVLLAALTPLASARPDLPGDGACEVRWGWTWPGESVGVTCHDDNGGTLLAASHGTCALGHYTYARVGDAVVLFLPCDLRHDLSDG